MPPANSVLLSEAVVERMPFLRNANVRFFDFGNVQILDQSTAGEKLASAGSKHGGGKTAFSGVVVITDEVIAIATFPSTAGAPIVVPHSSIVGVARDGNAVLVRNSFMNDLKLNLPKVDAFVVHLIGIQDRSMNRTLRLAGGEASAGSPSGVVAGQTASATSAAGGGGGGVGGGDGDHHSTAGHSRAEHDAVRRALSLAQELGTNNGTDASMERLWGVIRLGRGSSRAAPPTTELDEGSDASSVQTIQHVADSPRDRELHDFEDPSTGGVDNNVGDPLSKRRAGGGGGGGAHQDDFVGDEVEVPTMVTDAASLKRRLWYFFMYYDQSRLQYVDTLCSMHTGTDGKALMKELESQYGPEPHRFRWSIRDQTIYQREINSQLKAQLNRAQDELLLLKENPHEKSTAVSRVLNRKNEIISQMLGEPVAPVDPTTASTSNSLGNSTNSSQQQQQTSSWSEIFSSNPESHTPLSRMYHVLSFHDVVDLPTERASIEWTVICQGHFWNAVKQQVVALGPVRTTKPMIEVTDEDVREMIVCNRDFFLAWLAESHGECILHVRHTPNSDFCFMSLSEAFPHVNIQL